MKADVQIRILNIRLCRILPDFKLDYNQRLTFDA